MWITLESGGDCSYGSTQLGIRVAIANHGSADAGAFVLSVDGLRAPISGGLRAGDTLSIWAPTYVYMGENVAIVDVDNQVAERDETNNRLAQFVPIPTLPPTCTPTFTPTSTRSATPTPRPRASAIFLPSVAK